MKLKYRQNSDKKINVVASHTYEIIENNEYIGEFCLLFTHKLVSLWGLLIFQEYRGKGYAKKLLKVVIERLIAQGRHTLALYVKADNEPAIKLYESLGFARIVQQDSNSYYYELSLQNITIGNLPHFNDLNKDYEI